MSVHCRSTTMHINKSNYADRYSVATRRRRRPIHFISIATTLLFCSCAAPPSSEPRIEDMPRAQKIERAGEILHALEPIGYCAEMPLLADVLAGVNSRITVSRDAPELGYPLDEQGTMVGFTYLCRSDDGRERVSEHLVNLRTREVTLHQNDARGAMPGELRFDRSSTSSDRH